VDTFQFDRSGRSIGRPGQGFLPASTSERRNGSESQTVLTLPFGETSHRYEWSVTAWDQSGKQHSEAWTSSVDIDGDGKFRPTVGFDVPLEQIARFVLRIRPYRYGITFTDVPLRPGEKANVQCEVAELHP
jgi:hypothetical protein